MGAGVVAQIQALQRQEQPSGKTEQFSLALPKPKEDRDANRFVFARNVLRAHSQDGILPVEIRRLANEQGFSCPTNYPYKLLTNMVKQGTARKDEAGRCYSRRRDGGATGGKKKCEIEGLEEILHRE